MPRLLPKLIFLLCVMLAFPAQALVKKAPPRSAKSAKVVKKTASKAVKLKSRDRRKPLPYVLSPKAPEVVAPDITPHQHTISPETLQAMAKGNWEESFKKLQLEPASDKVAYLLNQIATISAPQKQKNPLMDFNRAEAYHNVTLFLQRNQINAKKVAEKSLFFYRKAEKYPELSQKSHILTAALYASMGDKKRSEQQFIKVDPETLRQWSAPNSRDFNGLEYLSAYYAANGQIPYALTFLDRAFQANPILLMQWLHVADDFWMLENNEEYLAHLNKWRTDFEALKKPLKKLPKKSRKSRKK